MFTRLPKRKDIKDDIFPVRRSKRNKSDSSYSDQSESECSQEESDLEYDRNVKYTVSKIKNARVKRFYNEVRVELMSQEPNVNAILKSKITVYQKARLVELCEIYLIRHPSEDKIQLKQKINRLFDFYQLRNGIKHLHQTEENKMLMELAYLKVADGIKTKLFDRYEETIQRSKSDEEYHKMMNWIRVVVKIPFNSSTPIKGYHLMSRLKFSLDKEIYGQRAVKEQLMLYVNDRVVNAKIKGSSIGLVGPPGCGKTTLVMSLARGLGVPFYQISCGGVTSASFFNGHSYTYIGSQPGSIVQALTHMQAKNGIIFFDEFDKIGDKPEITASFLHILDPVQNVNFKDKFVGDIPIDLSNIWFIYSMNQKPKNNALRDRIHIIDVNGYTRQEKRSILVKHIIPYTMAKLNIAKKNLIFTNDAIDIILTMHQSEKGVRQLKTTIHQLISRILFTKTHRNVKMSFDTKIKFPCKVKADIVHKIMKDKKTGLSQKILSMYC